MEKNMKENYHFLRVIGEGGFSRVYLAEGRNGQRYACKVSGEVKMLEREAEMLSRLYHPLFPAYIGYEERDGTGRLMMEYIHGRSLGQMMRLRGRFSVRQTMRFAEELADGLRYLHERQPAILYRDLKPENVMLCQDGHIKLVDLGCACYQDAQGRVKAGTPGFAPPEQLTAGGIAGIYSDVYCLGKTIQSIMAESGTGRGEAGKRHRGGQKRYYANGCHGEKRRGHIEDRTCRRRLEHMIEESVREDSRLRPQDMVSISNILTGESKKEEGIICEKNIWESSYKNSCSLPSI